HDRAACAGTRSRPRPAVVLRRCVEGAADAAPSHSTTGPQDRDVGAAQPGADVRAAGDEPHRTTAAAGLLGRFEALEELELPALDLADRERGERVVAVLIEAELAERAVVVLGA